jgi:hypothetical protein
MVSRENTVSMDLLEQYGCEHVMYRSPVPIFFGPAIGMSSVQLPATIGACHFWDAILQFKGHGMPSQKLVMV